MEFFQKVIFKLFIKFDFFYNVWFNIHHIKFLSDDNDYNSFINILYTCINRCSNPYNQNDLYYLF